MNSLHTPNSLQPGSKTRSCFHPATWNTGKRIVAATVASVVLLGGWAAFRPEKLFINETVSESLALSGQNAPMLISGGSFSSLGHHTEGKAQLFKGAQGYILRFSGFSTSNGPDVRVYLTEKAGTDSAAINAGKFLDLGTIKGNIGDQNYALPASFDPAKFQGVSIWCKRFAVNFAGASLLSSGAPPIVPVSRTQKAVAPAASNQSVVVTTGEFRKVGEGVSGRATITEDGAGQRTLTLTNFRSAKGPNLRVYLLKAGDARDSKSVKKAGFIDLGQLKSLRGTQSFAVPKNIDLWQYLAVTIWCDQFKVNFATAPLGSPQN